MIARLLPAGHHRKAFWPLARLGLLAAATGALAFLAGQILLAAGRGEFAPIGREAGGWALIAGALVYLMGHGFRILRLAMLVGGYRIGLRLAASFHLMSAAVSLTAPLKLGELYRVLELSNIAGGLVRAVMIVWWERVFDVALILIMLLMAFALTPAAQGAAFYAVAATAALFILATTVAVFLLPDNLRRLSIFIIRRYDSRRTVPALKVMDVARRGIQEAPRMLQGKTASLATLTALIWLCEMACFAIVAPSAHATLKGALGDLLAFLSAVTRGATLLGALAPGEAGDRILAYLTATQVPLALLGLAAAAPYIVHRLRQERAR